MVYHLSFISRVCAFSVFLQVVVLFFSMVFILRAFPLLSPSLLKATHPKRLTANVPVNPDVSPSFKGFLIFFLFPTVGHNPWSSWRSHISGFSYTNAGSRVFFHFGGCQPLHEVQFLIFCNPLEISTARFMISSPMVFL